MLDGQNEVVETQDSNTPVEAQQEQQVQQQAPRDDREYNFKLMRERAEQAEFRAREAERYVESLKKPIPDSEFNIEDDGLVEGRHYKKQAQTVKEIKDELTATRKQLEQFSMQSAEQRLRQSHPDFDRIVTKDNLDRLSEVKPSLYRSIMSNPDIYEKGDSAADAIKMYLQPEKYANEDKRIAENKAKPRNASTVGPQQSDSPLTRVGDYDRRTLTEDRRRELRQEMEEARSRY